MRFSVESRAERGLRIIPEIPHISPCLIEGRNGIGKTVLIRLLELISGRQPFADQESQWHSLRERLGKTRISMENFNGGQLLSFTFTPDRWPPSGKAPLVIDEWLGQTTLDGQEISAGEVQQLISVERIAGNEDLDVTLRRRLGLYEDRSERARSVVEERVRWVETCLAPLIEEIEPADPVELLSGRKELWEAEERESSAQADLDNAVRRHEEAVEALEARNALREIRSSNQELEARRQEIVAAISANDQARSDVEGKIEEAAELLRRQGDVEATVAEAQQRQRYRLKRQRKLARELTLSARLANVGLTPEELTEAENLSRGRLEQLKADRHALDATGLTARLIDRLTGLLDGSSWETLGGHDLLVLPERRLTVEQTRSALSARAEEISNQPTPDEVQQLEREIGLEMRKLVRVRHVVKLHQDAARQEELVAEANGEVERAEARLRAAMPQDDAYREFTRRLASIEEEADRLAGALSDVHASLGLEGGRSPEDAAADLSDALRALGLEDESELDQLVGNLRREVDHRSSMATSASNRAAALRRTVTLLAASIETTVATLLDDARFAWLRNVEGVLGALSVEETSVVAYERLRAAAMRIDTQLQEARRLPEILSFTARTIMTSDEQAPNNPLADPLRRVLGEELRSALDRPQIRRFLFEGAELVEVDAVRQQLVLQRPDGLYDTRSFGTFSTGEQAFAFTQARIRELEPEESLNRLLVLDEFGAFVAADRLPALGELLASPEVAAIAQQVVVMLPVQTDYSAEVSETQGELRLRYQTRADQIQANGYCAVPFDAP